MTDIVITQKSRRRLALMVESDGPGGAESVILTLADGLRKSGIDVFPVVFSPGQGWMSGQLREAGFELFQPTLRSPFDPGFVIELARWLRERRIDHIHAHEFTMGFYAGAAGVIAKVPHSITMHGGKGFAGAIRRRIALSVSARLASCVVGVSEETCEHLSRALWLPRSSMKCVPNGIRVRKGVRGETRDKLNLSDDVVMILAVGNLYEVKGHRYLIEAASLLSRNSTLPNWKILVAGRGDLFDSLRAMIQAEGLERRVELLGLRNDIPDLLAAADGWVMPSLSEGLPMALLEAMFARVPVVCTSVGGIPSLVKNDLTGWLVGPGDSTGLALGLESLILDRTRRERFRESAFLLAERDYGQMRMVERYIELYRWKNE